MAKSTALHCPYCSANVRYTSGELRLYGCGTRHDRGGDERTDECRRREKEGRK